MIYLDNSATTRVSQEAAKKALYVMTECFGNPSSLHSLGFKAELEIKNARKIISSLISCREGEIFFTSGGTEANNTAILGAARANAKRGNKIVVSAVEHSSCIDAAKHLSMQGFEVVFVSPDENGCVSPQKIADAVDEKTVLVALMLVNNETGAVFDVATAFAGARRKNNKILTLCDCVQAFGKIPVHVGRLGADMISITAHKIGGPKGCGALYVKKGSKIQPLIFGGQQQNAFRPGTENAASIAAFAVAADETNKKMPAAYSSVKELKNRLIEGLEKIDGVKINSPENAIPYVVNFSTNKIKSETMMHFLEQKEIYVSGGSACAKGSRSHVLSALSFDDKRIDTAIRVSFNGENTVDDIDAFLEAVKEGIETLQKIK